MQLKTIKKILLLLFTFLFGIVTGVIAWQQIKNYEEPFKFAGIGFIIFGSLGLIIYKKSKKRFLKRHFNSEQLISIQVSIISCFIGPGLLLMCSFNSNISAKENCLKYKITNYKYSKGGFRRPGKSIVIFETNHNLNHINLNKSNFDNYSKSDSIPICYYSSPIGFDYIKLNKSN